MSQTTNEVATHEVMLTDVAAAKVASLLEQEGRDDLRLRVGVQPGGCSGLVYQLYFDERVLDGDAIRAFGEEGKQVEVIVDRMSIPYPMRLVRAPAVSHSTKTTRYTLVIAADGGGIVR